MKVMHVNASKHLRVGDVILSQGKRNNWFSRLIRRLTKSNYSHAMIYFGRDLDGKPTVIEASAGGVELNPLSKYDGIEWVALRHQLMTPYAWTKMKAWLKQQLGKPYDYKGLLGYAAYLLGLSRKNWWDDKKAYWCSELVADAYLNAGLHLSKIPKDTWKVSPQDLFTQKMFYVVGYHAPNKLFLNNKKLSD